MRQLLIASNNPGKIEEMSMLLKGIRAQVLTPGDIGLNLDVAETGGTYLENAHLKAAAFCHASGRACLADDTGLEVAALGGAPGLRSKRYAPHPQATDADRRALLLQHLANEPRPWLARFVCAAVLMTPDGELIENEGSCEGEIIAEERGDFGFGYDRIFLVREVGKTMAELTLKDKNRISHRALAIQGIIPFIHPG